MRVVWNDRAPAPAWPEDGDPRAFHRRLPGYEPTQLLALPAVARNLGIGQVWMKDETQRLGLPAFKILGASWATYRLLVESLGAEPEWSSLDDLRRSAAPLGSITLVTATDGNHGRAVARAASWLGFGARVYVPPNLPPASVDAIRNEGAVVLTVDGTYDDAVATAARDAGDGDWIVSDTSWPGYTDVPRWVIQGYSTMFREIEDAVPDPDCVFVQMGVGALASAAALNYRSSATNIVGVEPASAACVLESIAHDEVTLVPGPHNSVMSGLNCGLVSEIAWPLLRSRIDACIAIPDEDARVAVDALAAAGVRAGPSGVAGLAGLISLLNGSFADEARQRLRLTDEATILVLVTEGAS